MRKKRNTLDDLHIIHQLETQYGEEIPEVPYGHRGIGYHMNITGRVVSLNLFEELEDTTLLGELKHLQRLSLRDAQITNIDALSQLTELQQVDLSNCSQLADVAPLGELPKLRRLSLAGTQVAGLKVLSGLQELQSLDIRFTPIKTLAGLHHLQELNFLDCSICNDLADFEGLDGLENLRTLKLEGVGITDLAAVAPLTQLKYLDLNYCRGIKHLKPLEDLLALQTLTLSHCLKITDWPLLAEHNSLWHLNVAATTIDSLEPLNKMKELKWVNLSHNPGVTNLSPLQPLKHLVHIDLRHSGLAQVPKWLLEKNLELVYFDGFESNTANVFGNPLEAPPLTVAEQGTEAMVQFLEGQEE